MILTHMLKALILFEDTLTFNVKFTATNDDASTSNVVDFDNARCKMVNDSRNRAYWIVTVEDGHYAATDPTTYVKDSAAGTINLGQDWFIEKDDIDLDDNLCTPPVGDESWDGIDTSYFACKEIHCEMRRVFNTGDFYDLDFVTNGSAENMLIAAGDASLQMNQSTIDAANLELVTNSAAITIKVVKGALSGIVTSAFATAALLSSFSF